MVAKSVAQPPQRPHQSGWTMIGCREAATKIRTNLSRLTMAIGVFGQAIGAPGWADMPLVGGRFATGAAGTDYIAGAFRGPDQEEVWGVLDTGAYVGAFGARRER